MQSKFYILDILNHPIINTIIGASIAVLVGFMGVYLNNRTVKKRDRFSSLKLMHEAVLKLLDEASTRLKAQAVFDAHQQSAYSDEEAKEDFLVELGGIDRLLRMPFEYFQDSFFTQYWIVRRESYFFRKHNRLFARVEKNIHAIVFYNNAKIVDEHFFYFLTELIDDLTALEKDLRRELSDYFK